METLAFMDIEPFTSNGNYAVNVGWRYVEEWIRDNAKDERLGFDMDPDFQRGHVWTEKQQRDYVEFCLRGGVGSSEIRWNCVGWMGSFRGPFVLVDGKQRLESVRKFLRGELSVFGRTREQFTGPLRCDFIFRVNDLPTRELVLKWYLEINSGGVVHSTEELDRVRKLLRKEQRAKEPTQ